MRVTMYFNVEHDMCYCKFDHPGNMTQLPTDVINRALWLFYNKVDPDRSVFPFLYNIWDSATDSRCIGFMICESMDLSDIEATALAESILDGPPQIGEFEPLVQDF